MWKVIAFQNYTDLQKYLNDNSIAAAKVVGFAVDASGQYVVVIAP